MVSVIIPLVYVGLGGLLGAILRYLMTLAGLKVSVVFPYGTLASNLLGCFFIGVIAQLAADTDLLSSEARLFLATGLCGGFTTLSSMIYELAQLLKDNEIFFASIYFAATFFGALFSFYLGSMLIGSLARL
jgi:CrcB protein